MLQSFMQCPVKMDHIKTAVIIICVLYLATKVEAQVNCTANGAGRFADPSDTICKNYTLCVLDINTNTYQSYDYVCPTTSLFNPNSRLCTTNYVCNVVVTTTVSPVSDVCTADSIVPDPNVTDCSSYIICVADNGTFDETPQACPPGFFFDPATTLCEQNYTCPATSLADFSCTAVGRFPDTTDTTCQGYFFCVQANDGTFQQYNYTCPNTAVFSPTTRLCTTSYVCPTATG